MAKKYYCFDCGTKMDWVESTLICPCCGKTWTPKVNREVNVSYSNNNNRDYSTFSNNDEDYRYNGYNSTYHERYEGTDYDWGSDWDYDEYPPENL